MKYLKKYTLFEKSLEEAVEELKEFQQDMDLNSNLTKLLDSIDSVELDINTIFPFLEGSEDISELEDNSKFINELKNRNLRISELFDTQESATLIKIRLRYYWIYTEDSTDLEIPVYILFQWVNKDNTLSPLKLYYVQKDISNFYNELSTVTLEITQKSNKDKKWVYITSNSGQNWVLQNKDKATTSFKKTLSSEEVEQLAKYTEIELIFF